MRVVSDTSPVSNLAIIGRLELLRRLYGMVLIPAAVAEELSRLKHPAGSRRMREALNDGWLKVEPLTVPAPPVPRLHMGETEALALAEMESGTLLLMDEDDGRQVAKARGVHTTGVVGVLIAANRRGWLDAVKPELLALREARFFISPRLFAEVLAAVGESA